MNLLIFVFMNKLLLILVLTFLGNVAWAQDKDDDVVYDNAIIFSPTIKFIIPGADLADRFGIGYQFGVGVDYRFKKNWFIGGEGGFVFGTNVKEKDHLQEALSAEIYTVNSDGALEEVNLNLRGALVQFNAGKSFFFRPDKPGNGVLIKMGAGYFHHKILIDVDKRLVPQLSGAYAKGYDRLSSGLVLSQYIGLIRLDRGKFVNLSFGFELSEALTANRRAFDFGTQQKISGGRIDLMYGFKLSWMIPVFIGESSQSQYYTY